MSGVRFIRMYPTDWRSGCIGLTPEEEGVYIRVCAHYWETGVRLTSDDLASASRIMLDVRMWRRIKANLVQKGKLHVADDGTIYNPRAEAEFRKATGAEEKSVRAADMDSARGSNDREQEDRGNSVQGRGASRQELLAKSETSLADIGEKSAGSRGEVSENFAKKPNEINGPFREPIANSQKSESETHAGHGVIVNCDTIRHPAFTISLPAIRLGTQASGLTAEEVKTHCIAHALQWAAEIEGGKLSGSVVPSKIANFLSASIMGATNRKAAADNRKRSVFATEDASAARKRKLIETSRRMAAESLAREAANGRA